MTDDPALAVRTRRSVLGLAAASGAATLLAACGGEQTSTENAAPGGNSPVPSAEEASSPDGGGEALVKTADVPVGSGVILSDPKVVVAQPTAGQFKAYSSICTHQSCPVSGIEGKTISCQCHGSAFDVKDGSPLNGPASRPLREIKVKVEGDSVVKA